MHKWTECVIPCAICIAF